MLPIFVHHLVISGTGAGMSGLSSLVRPCKEVLESTLDESIFAAPPVYDDAAEFRSCLHPTSGL